MGASLLGSSTLPKIAAVELVPRTKEMETWRAWPLESVHPLGV
ncbi:hypothetical protein [Actinomadura miaoliensis]